MKSRLNVLLAERRMTKRQVERALGVSKGTVYLWSTDRGIEGITLRNLSRLAEALGCRMADIFEEKRDQARRGDSWRADTTHDATIPREEDPYGKPQ